MRNEFRMKNYELFHVKRTDFNYGLSFPVQRFFTSFRMTTQRRNGTCGGRFEGMFHVIQCTGTKWESPLFHARLNHRRSPQNLFCARVRLYAGDRAGLTSCSVRQIRNLNRPAGIAPCFSFKTARSSNPSEALPSEKSKSRSETKSCRGPTPHFLTV